MNRRILLGVCSGAIVAALTTFFGVGTTAQVEAQAPDEPPAKRAEGRALHLVKIQHEFALKQLNRVRDELVNHQERIRQKEVDLDIKMAKLKQLDASPISPEEVEALIQRDPQVVR